MSFFTSHFQVSRAKELVVLLQLDDEGVPAAVGHAWLKDGQRVKVTFVSHLVLAAAVVVFVQLLPFLDIKIRPGGVHTCTDI